MFFNKQVILFLFVVDTMFSQSKTFANENSTSLAKRSIRPDCECGLTENRIEKRIVGGIAVHSTNDYPWHAAIKRNFRFLCSGVLVSKNYVLTAASCFFNVFSRERIHYFGLKVGVGVTRLFGDKTMRPYIGVKKVVIHQDYDPGFLRQKLDNNIALIQLDERVDDTSLSIMPVCLPLFTEDDAFLGQKAIATGWGKDGFYGYYHNNLQVVKVQTRTHCDARPSPSTFCAASNPTRNICKGDIGSPLVAEEGGRNVLLGIAIYGRSCGYQETRFTRVKHFMDWITKNIKNTNGCF